MGYYYYYDEPLGCSGIIGVGVIFAIVWIVQFLEVASEYINNNPTLKFIFELINVIIFLGSIIFAVYLFFRIAKVTIINLIDKFKR